MSSKALQLQAKELKASVDQQTKLVEAQELSLANYERSLEPLLALEKGPYQEIEGENYLYLKIINKGEYCYSVVVTLSDGDRTNQYKLEPLFKDFERGFFMSDDYGAKVMVQIDYLRRSGFKGKKLFEMNLQFEEGEHWYSISSKHEDAQSFDEPA